MGVKDFFQIDPLEFARYLVEKNAASNYHETSKENPFDVKIEALRLECIGAKGPNFSPRIYIFEKAGDEISDTSFGYALYAKAQCYIYAGATCRQKVIQTLSLYLERGDWDGLPDGFIQHGGLLKMRSGEDILIGGIKIPKCHAIVASLCVELAKAYEGEYIFDKAYHYYMEADRINPYYSFGMMGAAKVLVKMENYEKAISLLSDAANSIYYPPVINKLEFSSFEQLDDTYKHNIDRTLEDIKAKQARGYVFKQPKKKKD